MKHSLEKNVCISSSRMTASDSVSFQVWSTLRTMSASQQTILGLLCVPCGTRQQMAFMPSLCRTKHNRAKPMSELASALFSIADANEFRFARFYIVCEGVMLGTLKSPIIICGLSDTSRGLSKRGKDTESDAWRDAEEMLTFCSKEPLPASSTRNMLSFYN